MRFFSTARVGGKRARSPRVATILTGLSLAPVLAGHVLGTEKPDAAIPIPPAFKAANGAPHAALPAANYTTSLSASYELGWLSDKVVGRANAS